jgi:hypothetical protein
MFRRYSDPAWLAEGLVSTVLEEAIAIQLRTVAS